MTGKSPPAARRRALVRGSARRRRRRAGAGAHLDVRTGDAAGRRGIHDGHGNDGRRSRRTPGVRCRRRRGARRRGGWAPGDVSRVRLPAGSSGPLVLVPQIVDAVSVPVIAAGGIMDGRGIVAARALGAQGVQLGTAFLSTDEAGTSPAHRSALGSETTVTAVLTGRAARSGADPVVDRLEASGVQPPDFPLPRAFLSEAPMLTGQGGAMARSMPAAELGPYARRRGRCRCCRAQSLSTGAAADGSGSEQAVWGCRGRPARRRSGCRPAPAARSSRAPPGRDRACRRRARRGHRGWTRAMQWCTASISSRTISTCLQRAPSSML